MASTSVVLSDSRNLIPFQFKNYPVRALRDEYGEPWFVAKDVCDVLGLQNVSKACRNLDADEKATITISNSQAGQGAQSIITISEPGFYKLVLRSRKVEANDFQRWATHEVLPTVRRTGSYSLTGESDLGGIVKELVSTVRELGSMVKGLLPEKTKLPAVPPVRTSFEIRKVVNKYATRSRIDFQICWNQLYDEFLGRHGIDLYTRAQARGTTGVKIAEELGMADDLLALAIHLYD